MQFQVYVKDQDGRSRSVWVSPDDKVEVIKTQLYNIIGVATATQRLIFAGKELQDGCTVRSYGIRKMSTLHLVFRLNGGVVPALSSAGSV
jgi:hypothetical protein